MLNVFSPSVFYLGRPVDHTRPDIADSTDKKGGREGLFLHAIPITYGK
jgi:hypothetical protein